MQDLRWFAMRNIPDFKLKILEKFFAAQSDVAAAYLFGSYGTEYEHPKSDLDLGLVFRGKQKLERELQIETELSLLLKTDKIDFVNLNLAPVALQFRVLSEGLLIYERDYILNSNFIECVLREYRDYSFHYTRFAAESRRALWKEYPL